MVDHEPNQPLPTKPQKLKPLSTGPASVSKMAWALSWGRRRRHLWGRNPSYFWSVIGF